MSEAAIANDNAKGIDRNWIARRIPHQGGMCLLDGVERWDENSVVCRASSHRRADNPLRAEQALGIANAIEYAAQAVAVHCALLMDKKMIEEASAPTAGYLTSVRQVNWHRSRFDNVSGALRVGVRRISGDEITVLYGFEIHANDELLVGGRASVVLNAAAI